MSPTQNDAGKSGGENRQISQSDLVVLATKAEAYDLIKQLESTRKTVEKLAKELSEASRKSNEATALAKALLSVIYTESERQRLLDKLGQFDKGLREKAESMFEQMHTEQIHEQM